ncbi:MAG: SDR family NAD(P)-dependent oxidoreductase [Pseudomonadota bacterium]
MRTILGIILFYGRFGLSFSAIGFWFRRLFWQNGQPSMAGQTVLVTGASGGIGAAVVAGCAASGARVIAVARNPDKLASLKASVGDRVVTYACDLAETNAVNGLADAISKDFGSIDVLVNNVGVMLHDFVENSEGVDAQFATNLLNQYVFTERLVASGVLAEEGAVITVASGGMYMAPLVTSALCAKEAAAHDGTRAYAVQKRAQVALTQHWQQSSEKQGQRYYVMHPGWVDTAGVQQSLPTFRKLLRPVLRTASQGADTIIWLASERPEEDNQDRIWLDRKARKTHAYGFTRANSESTERLLRFLKTFL